MLMKKSKEVGDDGRTRMSTPELEKADGGGGAPAWHSEDGLSIPKTGTPDRRRWDRLFVARVRDVFGAGVQPRKFRAPLDQLQPRNPPMNAARLDMYSKMAHKDKLPPIVVEKRHDGWYIVDGNHRYSAAKSAGHTHMDAIELR